MATRADVPALRALIERSARALCVPYYSADVVEGALTGPFGVDTTLIDDATYWLIEEDGTPIACGGWSRRATPFGGDAWAGRDVRLLDPQTEPAKIRAFFVAPECAGAGLGGRLLDRCEGEARAAGFSRFVLTATLSGVSFYERRGYARGAAERYPVPGGQIDFVVMTKG
ncbi:GNAT family N-acetyltransferase [Parvularcula dongshanensis]|uniref:GNAT superfamily N-acetyltransferase n=1 Tax=Parvularcula dongshanensis TaxID=1173995 RepID=A0A840I2V5_9PROT|nr:GNAT family N-acetyltransferase [Parvularcula dongshanensis]MBB4658632.1 GNAT superfamily N-acetyltransferase [Parvularcula dongshanensis]